GGLEAGRGLEWGEALFGGGAGGEGARGKRGEEQQAASRGQRGEERAGERGSCHGGTRRAGASGQQDWHCILLRRGEQIRALGRHGEPSRVSDRVGAFNPAAHAARLAIGSERSKRGPSLRWS